ncbi:hypothetical protein N9A28_07520 [Sulfurimonas sp.]|nr:hypothetical protein [Sulfurimonas sp.]
MLKVIYIILIGSMFIGCTKDVEGLTPIQVNNHKFFYKTNYDFSCSFGHISLFFKKGVILAPVSVGGIDYGDHKESIKLPEHTLGLEVRKPISGQQYILIYPDGSLVSDRPLAVAFKADYMVEDMSTCNNQNKHPFKRIENK